MNKRYFSVVFLMLFIFLFASPSQVKASEEGKAVETVKDKEDVGDDIEDKNKDEKKKIEVGDDENSIDNDSEEVEDEESIQEKKAKDKDEMMNEETSEGKEISEDKETSDESKKSKLTGGKKKKNKHSKKNEAKVKKIKQAVAKEKKQKVVENKKVEVKQPIEEKAVELKPIVAFTDEEFRILASVIFLEAGNQPFNGKVAVANVVLNRVQSKSFPESISKVIYQKAYGYYQFGLAKPGGKLERALQVYGKRTVAWERSAEEEAIKAAKAALYGERAIPDHLCFFVMKNSLAGRRYMKNKPGGVIIADHYFYKW